jgi:hypothetical protein
MQTRSEPEPPGPGPAPRPAVEPLDLVVILSGCALLALDPPVVKYLSYHLGPRTAFSGDLLGNVLTALCTLLVLLYALLALGPRPAWGQRAKLAIVLALGAACFLLPAVDDVLIRHRYGLQQGGRQMSFAHDGGVVQTEAALGFLLQGRSPYSADYRQTEMPRASSSSPHIWRRLGLAENPAYDFYPYPPLILLGSAPLYLAARATLGWFDQRMVYLLCWGVLALLAYRLPARRRWRIPLMALLTLNPAAATSFVVGTNDVLYQVFVVACLWALTRRRPRTAALMLGLACGCKQLAWLLVPLYFAYLHGTPGEGGGRGGLRALARSGWPLLAAVLVVFLPFLIWDPAGFSYSVLVAQGIEMPFRTDGLGLTSLLVLLGVVRSPTQEFSTAWMYAAFFLPVYALGLWQVLRQRTLSSMLLWYALGLGVFLALGHHFAKNYLTVIFYSVSLAAALAAEEPRASRAAAAAGPESATSADTSRPRRTPK